jgi:hypothetical protein
MLALLSSPEKNHMVGLEASAEARAARLGMTIDQLLVDDRHALRTSGYPTNDCFRPHEIEQFARGDLSEERILHGETCEACAALLVAAQSWERPLDVFLDEVRDQKRAFVNDDLRVTFTDALVAGGPVAVLGLITAGLVYARWDAIMSVAFGPLGWTPVVALLVAMVLAVAAVPFGLVVAKRLGLQVSFRRFGGAAIAGVFAMGFVAYGGAALWALTSNYQRVQSAEELALGIAASKLQKGETGQIAVPASTRTLMGSIIAEPKKDWVTEISHSSGKTQKVSEAFDIYWDEGSWTNNLDQTQWKNLSTAYVGQLERQSDGKLAVRTSKQKIELNVSSAQLSQLKGNETVFAVVPASEQVASKVLPVEQLLVQGTGLATAER